MGGDVRHDPNANYMAVIPGGAYHSLELDEDSGDFSLLTFVAAPEYDPENKLNTHTADELVKKFPEYEGMIRRLNDIRKDDVPMESENHNHSVDLRGHRYGGDHNHDHHHGGNGHHDDLHEDYGHHSNHHGHNHDHHDDHGHHDNYHGGHGNHQGNHHNHHGDRHDDHSSEHDDNHHHHP